MRVLITRPEREATALAQALSARGHSPVIAPLFRVQMLHPPADFAAALASCQAVLITSVNGARALAEASEHRSKPIFAVGDTTAATAEGLGFTNVTTASGDAAGLSDLIRQRLDPAAGPLLHVSGTEVAGELSPEGFEVRRFVLYEARAAEVLPDSARAALEARAIDVATFFSPRASETFVRLVTDAKLAGTCRAIAAVAISPAAARPLGALPFAATVAAERPTRSRPHSVRRKRPSFPASLVRQLRLRARSRVATKWRAKNFARNAGPDARNLLYWPPSRARSVARRHSITTIQGDRK